jgi:hypothetical protein
VTSRRGRGEDPVYLDGERWRGAASLGYGPDGGRIRKKVSDATKAEVLLLHPPRNWSAHLGSRMWRAERDRQLVDLRRPMTDRPYEK